MHGPKKSGNTQGKGQQKCPLVTLREMITLLRWHFIFIPIRLENNLIEDKQNNCNGLQ